MNALVQTIIPQAFVGSLPWWYYDLRIGWLGTTYFDRVSMRWLDVAALGVLAASGFLFSRQLRVAGAHLVTRLFRIAMLLSLALALCLAATVILTFIVVPYVPASFPPATPATWVSIALGFAAPLVAIAATLWLIVTAIYVWFTRNRVA
jgi:hypothetical protein